MSFALLTAFLTLGLPGAPWPPPWAMAAGALLGVGAHFLNVVPDVADDLAAGVRGLPQRLGARVAAVTGAALLAAACALVVLGPDGATPWWAWLGLAAALACAAAAAVLGARSGPRSRSRGPFLLAVATAAVAVLLLVGRGADLDLSPRRYVCPPCSAADASATRRRPRRGGDRDRPPRGCSAGFDATSTKPYAPSDGVIASSGDMRVLNALVVAAEGGDEGAGQHDGGQPRHPGRPGHRHHDALRRRWPSTATPGCPRVGR